MCMDRKCLWGCCCCFQNMKKGLLGVVIATAIFAMVDIVDATCVRNDAVSKAWMYAAAAVTLLFSAVAVAGIFMKKSLLVAVYLGFYMASLFSDTVVVVLKEIEYQGPAKSCDSGKRTAMLLAKLWIAIRILLKVYFIAVIQSGFVEIVDEENPPNA